MRNAGLPYQSACSYCFPGREHGFSGFRLSSSPPAGSKAPPRQEAPSAVFAPTMLQRVFPLVHIALLLVPAAAERQQGLGVQLGQEELAVSAPASAGIVLPGSAREAATILLPVDLLRS